MEVPEISDGNTQLVKATSKHSAAAEDLRWWSPWFSVLGNVVNGTVILDGGVMKRTTEAGFGTSLVEGRDE